MNVLLVGGMSAGHIAPLVAVWRALEKKFPHAKAHVICSERKEDIAFVRAEGMAFSALPAPRMGLTFPFAFLRSFAGARRTIAAFRPDVVFSKGGALSVPACLAARLRGIPIVLHESDAVSGRANALVARWATTVCTGFPTHYSLHTTHFTGNPTREEITQGSADEARRITGFSGKRPVLLVLGGSQGSAAINAAVTRHLDALLALCDVAHLTGPGKESGVTRSGYWSRPFVRDELPHLYAVASLAVSRAGAGAIGELAANGVPAVLVPLRGVGHDHQYVNARAVEERGGCVRLEQENLDDALVTTVAELLSNEPLRKKIATQLKEFHAPHAAEKIAEVIVAAVERHWAKS